MAAASHESRDRIEADVRPSQGGTAVFGVVLVIGLYSYCTTLCTYRQQQLAGPLKDR